MEHQMVPEIDGSNPLTNPDAAAMALTGDTMTDLAAVAKEMGVALDNNGNVAEAPAQSAPVPAAQAPTPKVSVQPAPAAPTQTAEQPATTVEVPAKFQNEDGTPNVEKIIKAEENIDALIARYKAKEKEGQQLQNRVNNPAPAIQAAPAQPVAPQPLSPLEHQMAVDLINEAAAQGVQLDQRIAIAQAKVMAKGLEAKHSAELSITERLQAQFEDQRRTAELKTLIESDPDALSGGMADTLWKLRQENPWLNQAPEPWKAALHYFRGTQGTAQQVVTPTPKGTTPKAPPTAVGPVARVQKTVDISDKRAIQSLDNATIEAEIRKLYPNFRGK
jgi:hypothetical protein